MPCYFHISVLLLALVFTAPACAADKPSDGGGAAAHAGTLTCFSITPPTSGTAHESCDKLCAAKSAACTAVNSAANSFVPGLNCGSPPVPAVSLCRCCAVTR